MPPALVLTAGLGTRLRPLTLVRAKAAVPIAGTPLVRRIAAWLAEAGITDLVLNLHHLPATITSAVGDGADLGVRVRYSWEHPVVLGSAGGPKRALPILGGGPFLIVNGDTLTDVSVRELLAAHARSGALVTLAVVPNREHLKYGGVLLDAESRVTGFVPRGPAAAGSYHFIGVQAAHAAAFDLSPQGEPGNSIGGIYDRLVAARAGSVRGFVTDAAFWDVGTVADYWSTCAAFAAGGDRQGSGVRIHPTARVNGCVLWDDVEIGADAVLDECIVADGAVVPAGARHRREALVATGQRLIVTPFD
jgi:NDP-sugar pyrophosphorylase family protein